MAYNYTNVLLGFEDEFITEKNKSTVNFTTNKFGGKPDWPPSIDKKTENPVCSLCQLPRPLVLQIYAPIDHSIYHRTLYIFACINPNCWNQSESWTCIRVQVPDHTESIEQTTKKQNVTEWCQEADDWDDNTNNINEENGNVVNIERISDDDESCSFEESLRLGLGNISIDDRNANKGVAAEAQGIGEAVGRLHSPGATAEIEGDEGEDITVETPILPQRDLNALLQEITPLPQSYSDISKFSSLQFVPSFMSVGEETPGSIGTSDRHVRELLMDYQQQNNEISEDLPSGDFAGGGGPDENYEKGIPAHGDTMFHYFSVKVHTNPGQLIRYSREIAPPLLLRPLTDLPRCEYCKEEMIYELQVMPTIIPKLRLASDIKARDRLEFGTILVFTCRQSCWSTDSNMRKEFVVMQTENN